MQVEAKILGGMNALVTGGGRGVGLGIALALANEGCNVAVNYKDETGKAEADEVAERLKAIGVDSFSIAGNVRIAASVSAMFDEIARRMGRLNLLVNNAGIQVQKPLLDLTEEDWDSVMETNAKGCFLCTQAAAQLMKENGGGSIVNIGSGCNKVPFPTLASYSASKGGIEMFTKVAALELGPLGIRVNCVAPGAILVERTLVESPNYMRDWGKITPLGRVGMPMDVGLSVVYFASKYSEFVTGQTLWVDGGVFSQPVFPYRLA